MFFGVQFQFSLSERGVFLVMGCVLLLMNNLVNLARFIQIASPLTAVTCDILSASGKYKNGLKLHRFVGFILSDTVSAAIRGTANNVVSIMQVSIWPTSLFLQLQALRLFAWPEADFE